ncbi:hypothetical protein BC830DRAFT_487199 [Chytriomyces sp. MP71]|nr:hypothetical protein BC830DRAFT_487199 [Chytriomyces sp. MP71]
MASVAVIPPRANSRRSLVVGGPLLSPKPTVSPKPGLKQQQPPAIRCDEVPPPTLEQMVALKRSLLKRQFSSSSSVHSQQRELPHKASLPVLLQPTPSSPDNNSLFDFLLDFSNHDAPPDEQSNSPSQNSKEQFRSTLDTPSSSAIDRALERITDAHLSGCESNQMFSKNEASLPMIQSNLHFKLNEEFINYNPSQPFSARSSPHAAPPVPLTDQADTAATPFPTFDLHDWALTSAMPLIPDMPPLFTMEEAEQLALDLFGDAGLTRGMDTSLDFRAATPSVIPPADVLPPTTTSSMEEGVVFEDHESDMDEGECEDDQVAQQTNEVEYTCADGLEQEPTFNEETQQGRAADVLSSCPTKAPTSFNTHVASTGTAPSNAKRARGRPRRDPATLASAQLTEGAPIEPVIKRPRGRPRKIVDPNVPIITTAKKRKASASVVPGTTVIVMAEPEAGVISAVDVGKEEGAASDAEDEDISWMMKMAEAAAMGKELPKRTTPLINNEADAAKLSLHKFRPQRPMAPDLGLFCYFSLFPTNKPCEKAHQYLALKNPELDSKHCWRECFAET